MNSSPPSTLVGQLCAAVGLAVAIGLAVLALSWRLPETPAGGAGLVPSTGFRPCDVQGGGYWRGSVHAVDTLTFDWRNDALECDGNARPGDRGLRLFFAGRPDGRDERLMLVIGVKSRMDQLSGAEHPVSVTLIDEVTSSFFNSPGARCFARFDDVTLLRPPAEYRVAGELYCAGSIPAVAGPGSITLGDMAFAGRLALEQ